MSAAAAACRTRLGVGTGLGRQRHLSWFKEKPSMSPSGAAGETAKAAAMAARAAGSEAQGLEVPWLQGRKVYRQLLRLASCGNPSCPPFRTSLFVQAQLGSIVSSREFDTAMCHSVHLCVRVGQCITCSASVSKIILFVQVCMHTLTHLVFAGLQSTTRRGSERTSSRTSVSSSGTTSTLQTLSSS